MSRLLRARSASTLYSNYLPRTDLKLENYRSQFNSNPACRGSARDSRGVPSVVGTPLQASSPVLSGAVWCCLVLCLVLSGAVWCCLVLSKSLRR